jgi:hypothetical protein
MVFTDKKSKVSDKLSVWKWWPIILALLDTSTQNKKVPLSLPVQTTIIRLEIFQSLFKGIHCQHFELEKADTDHITSIL